jgi:hypothetical protein
MDQYIRLIQVMLGLKDKQEREIYSLTAVCRSLSGLVSNLTHM